MLPLKVLHSVSRTDTNPEQVSTHPAPSAPIKSLLVPRNTQSLNATNRIPILPKQNGWTMPFRQSHRIHFADRLWTTTLHARSIFPIYPFASERKKMRSDWSIFACEIYLVASIYAWRSHCVGSPVGTETIHLPIENSKYSSICVWCLCSSKRREIRKVHYWNRIFGATKTTCTNHIAHTLHSFLFQVSKHQAHTHTDYKWYFRQIYVKR